MMTFPNIRRLLAVGLLTISALIGFASSPPASGDTPALVAAIAVDEAEAHSTPAWRCKYLMWYRAANGERYAWMQRCRSYSMRHTLAHRYGRLWPCYVVPRGRTRNVCVIRVVFAAVGQSEQAVRVARCESSLLRFPPGESTYKGLFQLGPHERATYGYGYTAVEQARGALRLYRARGWQPWSCKPW